VPEFQLFPAFLILGGRLPQESCELADILIVICDLIIVVGLSFVVKPATTYPLRVVQNGAKLIIINKNNTALDNLAQVIIRDDITFYVPKLGEFL
jgi:NAD-dependent deacetylase